jgi:2'-5' RNA ligase
MSRIFVALRPPPVMRAALCRTIGGVPGARWQTDEQLHLTLRFLGEIDRYQLDELALALARVRAPALSLGIDGVGTFGTRGRPNSLWAAVAPDPDLARLARTIDRLATDIGLPSDDRAFCPHITVARLGRTAGSINGWLATYAGLNIPRALFSHLYLYESQLGREGSVYTVMDRYPLG